GFRLLAGRCCGAGAGFRRDALQVQIEAIELLLPHRPELLDPVDGGLERLGFEPARPLLSFTAARDEPGAFEDLQVFGDGRAGQRKWLGELLDWSVTLGEPRENCPPRGV